jgi:hypothetical protein
MDKLVKNYLESNKSQSAYTCNTFIMNVKRLEKILKLSVDEFDKNSFNNVNDIMDELTEKYSLNSIISTTSTIIFLLKYYNSDSALITEYTDYLSELVNSRTDKDESQIATEKELKAWIPFNELRDNVMKISSDYLEKKKTFTDFRSFLFLALYTLNIPCRIGNYLNMKYINEIKGKKPTSYDKKYNYIYKDETYHFVFNNYKTSKYVGQVVLKVDNEILNKLIDKWFNDYNTKGKEFLINYEGGNVNQTNMTHNLNSITKKLFNKSLSVNDFRHSFLTLFLSKPRTIKEKQTIAKAMGQKYKVSRMELYNRINVNDNEIENDNKKNNDINFKI